MLTITALGGPDARQTRRLVRVLLADPLTPEAEWEQRLSNLDNDDGRAVLLRSDHTDWQERIQLMSVQGMPRDWTLTTDVRSFGRCSCRP